MLNLGTNVVGEIEGDILTLKIDLSKTFGLSGSGKNVKVATTGGNVAVEGYDGMKLGLNVYRPAE